MMPPALPQSRHGYERTACKIRLADHPICGAIRIVTVEDQDPMIVGIRYIEPAAGIHLQPQGVVEAGCTDATVIGGVIGGVAGKVGLTNHGVSDGIRGVIGKDQEAMVAAVRHIEFIGERATGHRGRSIHAPVGWRIRCDIARSIWLRGAG